MGLASWKDLYLDELGTLYDAERRIGRTVPRLSEAASAPDLRAVLETRRGESQLHIARIELIFTHWGERRPLRESAGLAGIVQEADERLHQELTPDARDAAIVGIVQRMDAYEIAGYGSARHWAIKLNRPDEARLLQETLDEEQRAAARLAAIVQSYAAEGSSVVG
jgi:ferritin-like metal-binding protein YciE